MVVCTWNACRRHVNAAMCTTRDRSNYLVKSRESSFPIPAQTPVNVDHSRRTWYFFNPAAIELLRRPSLPFFPFPSRATRLFCKHSGNTWAHGDVANRLIIGALFIVPCSKRIAPMEKFRGIWEVSRTRRTFFSLWLSMHRLSRELLGERSNPLNKD